MYLFFKKNKAATRTMIGLKFRGKKNNKNIPATIGDDNSLITAVATIVTTNKLSYWGKTAAAAKPKVIVAKVIGKMSPPRQLKFKHQANRANFKIAIPVKNNGDLFDQAPINKCKLC